MTQTQAPIACTLSPDDGRHRIMRWRALHEQASPVVSREALYLEVRYAATPGGYAELVALAAAEQECCGFVTWSVSLDADIPVLTVTAPEDDPAALDAIAALFAF